MILGGGTGLWDRTLGLDCYTGLRYWTVGYWTLGLDCGDEPRYYTVGLVCGTGLWCETVVLDGRTGL